MKIQTCEIEGLKIIEPDIYADKRGYFFESYNQSRFFENGIKNDFIQDNQSKSVKNVIRALHYQLAPYSQAKLVRVLKGRVLDVAVDLRKGSPTFGQYFAIELSDENQLQFLIPRGFAHGFSTLSEHALLFYKCDNPYHKVSERGIIFNDPKIGVDWKIPTENALISDRDKELPELAKAEMNFTL